MQPSNKNNNVFADCFAALCFRLSGLVARFGGDKLRANFEEGVNTSAAARDAGLALREGRILSRNEDLDWTQYRDILAQVISRAREIAGDKTVKSEIRETVRAFEKQSGGNLYETSFRLGLLEHIND